MPRIPRLFVISGPSGAGKGTLIAKLREADSSLALAVSATTRSPRGVEQDGVEYYFISEEEFDDAVASDAFLEWAHVHGHRYGTRKQDVEDALNAGSSILLDIDVQGALNVRKAYPEAVLVFIEPPSLEELERRLRHRGTEDEQAIALRLKNAEYELELKDEYDVVIMNDDLDVAAEELLSVVRSFEEQSEDTN